MGTVQKGIKLGFKQTSVPINFFYLLYNGQTSLYDFAGTDRDNIEAYDASFSFENIANTDNIKLAYIWNQIPGTSNYGITLELTRWEFIRMHFTPKLSAHSGE